LSYSRFRYTQLKLASDQLKAADSLHVEAYVENLGPREGDEVVELYLSFPNTPGAPRHALRGFQRIHLRPGERKPLSFTLNSRDLSVVDKAGTRIVAPGRYQVSLGGGQPGTGSEMVHEVFFVHGQQVLPD